jgi:hypothetical protein
MSTAYIAFQDMILSATIRKQSRHLYRKEQINWSNIDYFLKLSCRRLKDLKAKHILMLFGVDTWPLERLMY